MKEVFQLIVEYNRKTNREIERLVLSLPEEEVFKERKTYFKSLFALVMHLIHASRYMLSLIRKHWNDQHLADELASSDFTVDPASVAEAFTLLKRYDELMYEFINSINETRLKEPKQSVLLMRKGNADISIWNILMQYIVHQTHHRGQISQLLDELGVDHDYGNVWPLYLEAAGHDLGSA